MFSKEERYLVLEIALRAAESRLLAGAKEQDIIDAAKAIAAAAKTIEPQMRVPSIADRVLVKVENDATPEAASTI